MRPEGPQEILFLSRRTRMVLRLPVECVDSARELSGQTLDVDGNALTLGRAVVRPLSRLSTLFSRYVISESGEDENIFLEQSALELAEMGIRVKKMLCGRTHRLSFPRHSIVTRSLMIDGLDVCESVELQRRGLGAGRKYGCGLFLPHKGIAALKKIQQK